MKTYFSELQNAIDYNTEVQNLRVTLGNIESIKNGTTELKDNTEKLREKRIRKQWMKDVHNEYNNPDFWTFGRFKNMMR